MKIISKFKDYYDYLQGVYGVDPKLILDRTQFTPITPSSDYNVYTFFICGYKYQGMFLNGKMLFGDELEPLSRKESYYLNHYDYYIEYGNKSYVRVIKRPLLDMNNINEKYNQPILLRIGIPAEYQIPMLKNFNFIKIIPAEKLWIMLSEWLSKDNSPTVIQSNKDKILSHGFDLKSSFRKTK
jgi:hypothetical protein